MIRSDGVRFAVSPQTINEETRSVDAVFSTQNPVMVFDPFRHEIVPEILLASGMRSGESVSLIDSHNRETIKNVLGSAVPRKDGDRIVGVVRFAKSSQDEFEKVRDGHITDFSVGYRISEKDSAYVERGESKEVGGVSFDGPVVIRTGWELKELSLVVVGADPAAKARAENDDKIKNTDKKEKNIMSDTEEVKKEIKRSEPAPVPDPVPEPKPAPVDIEAITRAAKAAGAQEERIRIEQIKTMCRKVGVEPDKYENGKMTVDEVQRALFDDLAAQHETNRVSYGESDGEKWTRQAMHGLMIRAGQIGMVDENLRGQAHPVAAMTAIEFGKECLKRAGVDFSGMDIMEIAKRAMTTSDFANVINTTANKALKISYMERPYLWQQFCSIGSANNFLLQTEVEVSRGGVLTKLTTENPEYPMKKFTDGAQTYSIDTYAGMWRFSRHMLINDQMNVVANSQEMAKTAGRTIEKNVFDFIISNPTMSDGNALFSVAHLNIAVGADIDPPTIATLNEAELAMSNQLDLDGTTQLDIQPVFLLAPTDIKGYTKEFLSSTWWSDQAAIGTVDAADSSTRANIWKGRLQEIYTAKFTSTTAWYLLGEKGETFEVSFLNGRQAPIMETEFDFNTKDMKVTLSSDHGVRAKDWKAVYYNAGT